MKGRKESACQQLEDKRLQSRLNVFEWEQYKLAGQGCFTIWWQGGDGGWWGRMTRGRMIDAHVIVLKQKSAALLCTLTINWPEIQADVWLSWNWRSVSEPNGNGKITFQFRVNYPFNNSQILHSEEIFNLYSSDLTCASIFILSSSPAHNEPLGQPPHESS